MNTNELVSRMKRRFNHESSKLYLQEKYTAKLNTVCQGGLWKISPQFIATLKSLPEVTILLDEYNSPTKINTRELLQHAEQLYFNVMEEWHKEYLILQNKR